MTDSSRQFVSADGLSLNFKCEKILQVKYRFKKNQNEVMRIIKSMKCKEKNEEKNYYVA